MNRDVGLDKFELLDVTPARPTGGIARDTQPSLLRRASAALRRVWSQRRAPGYTMLLPDGHIVITCCRKLAQLSGPPLQANACDRLACN